MFIKDITTIEKIQRRATKYMVNDLSLDYRGRLISLKLLPLMYFLELQDILVLTQSLKFLMTVLTSKIISDSHILVHAQVPFLLL